MPAARTALVLALTAALLGACSASSSAESAASTRAPSTTPGTPGEALLRVSQRVSAGSKPCGVLVVGNDVWVSGYVDGTLLRVARATGKVVHRTTVGSQPCGLAYGAGSIWVEDYGSSQLTQVNATTGRVRRTVAVGAAPYDVAFADGAAWVTDNLDGTVSRVDARTGHRTVVRTGGTPIGIVPADGGVWAGLGNGQVVRIDTRTAKVTDRLTAGAGSGWTAASGHDVWISNVAAGTVTHVDALSRTVVRTVAVGPAPQDGDAADGAVWVPLRDGTIVRLDARTDAVTARWKSGVGNPFVLDADGGQLWTADFKGTDLVALQPPG